jgi:hypothetical protein
MMSNIRAIFQNVIDEFQFLYDLPPTGDYQPLPWIGLNKAKRGEGTKSRWTIIEASLAGQSISSGMDIGCNMGYFCFSLADKGIPMLGIDVDRRYIRIAEYASRKIGLQRVGFSQMAITKETVCLLPQTDLVLLLSVWHHWVKMYGLPEASQILAALWERCGKVLFFETGEAEMTADFGLQMMGDSPQKWLETYLKTTCTGSDVECVGMSKAFAPLGNETRNVAYRNLFKITRVDVSLPVEGAQ